MHFTKLFLDFLLVFMLEDLKKEHHEVTKYRLVQYSIDWDMVQVNSALEGVTT